MTAKMSNHNKQLKVNKETLELKLERMELACISFRMYSKDGDFKIIVVKAILICDFKK